MRSIKRTNVCRTHGDAASCVGSQSFNTSHGKGHKSYKGLQGQSLQGTVKATYL